MWGKLMGIILGYQLAGITGSLIGIFMGHILDGSKKIYINFSEKTQSETSLYHPIFQKTIFSILGHLAKIDGPVNEKEIQATRQIMNQLNLNDFARQQAIVWFNSGKQFFFNMHQVLSIYKQENFNEKIDRTLLEMLITMAVADGILQTNEYQILLQLVNALYINKQIFNFLLLRHQAQQAYRGGQGYSSQHRQRFNQHPFSDDDSAYKILGVSRNSTNQELKKAFRQLMNVHHPDKLAARGLPENELKRAKEKAQQITTAYNTIKQNRGFK